MQHFKLISRLVLFIFLTGSFYSYLNGQTVEYYIDKNHLNTQDIFIKNEILPPASPAADSIAFNSILVSYDLKITDIGGWPGEILIKPGTDLAFVEVKQQNKILLVDLSTGEVLDSIVFEKRLEDILLNNSGTELYAALCNNQTGSIGPDSTYVINTTTLEITKRIFPYATPEIPWVMVGPTDHLLLSEDENLLYIVGMERFIYVYDLINNKLINVINAPLTAFYRSVLGLNSKRMFSLVISYPDEISPGRYLPMITNFETDSVKLVDLNSQGHYFYITSLPLVSPDGKYFFITSFDSLQRVKGMVIIDAATGELIKYIDRLSTESEFLYSADPNIIYVQEINYNQINYPRIINKKAIFNLSTFEVLGDIPIGGYPGGSSNDFKRIFSTDISAGSNSQIDYPGEGKQLTLVVYNVELNSYYTLDSYPGLIIQCDFRTIAVSENDYVVISNSSLNSVAIFSNITELPPSPVILITPTDSSANVSRNPEFTWKKPQSASGYYFQISDSSSFNNIVFEDSSLIRTKCSLEDLEADKNYYWRVKAKNLAGWGNWSAPISFRTIVAEPVKPVLMLPVNNTISVSTTPLLSWQKAPDAESYELYLSETESFTDYIVRDTNIADTVKQAPALKNDTKYYWKIRAKNTGGLSQYSDTWNFITIVNLPPRVVLNYPVDNVSIKDDSVKFTWYSAASSPEKYCLEISEDSVFSSAVLDSSATDTTKTLTGLKPNQYYWWKVKAKNAAGWGDFSEAAKFNTILTGVETINQPLEFSLSQNYPNPFNPVTQIKYSIKEPGNVSLVVYNMLGEKLSVLINEYQEAGSYQIEFKSENIPSGIYLYVIHSGNYSETKKMILLR